MVGRIEVVGSRIRLSGPSEASLDLTDDVRKRWSDWTTRYRAATGPEAPSTLLELGREIFGWLDSGEWAGRWAAPSGTRQLEITADATPTEDEQRLLNLPWEILADGEGHLAVSAMQQFEVWRRVGPAGVPVKPRHGDLALLFMAASPRNGGPEIDPDDEEAAIRRATERLELSLAVEESGSPDLLRERLDRQEVFEAIHLYCHGEVLDPKTAAEFAEEGAESGPVLLMETPEGGRVFVPPGALTKVWGGNSPNLVFLSGSRTAETTPGSTASYARALARAVPAVLGWNGPISNLDAILFAEVFYRELAGHETPARATASAREALLNKHLQDPRTGANWHLARLWLGSGGGGRLTDRECKRRRLPESDAGYRQLLDSKRGRGPEVAGPLTQLRRRRETQAVLTAFRENATPGVLVHGADKAGKSSLAARVANRTRTLETVVIYKDYDPLAVLKQLGEALRPEKRESLLQHWRQEVTTRPEAVAEAVEAMLEEHFDHQPVLLIIDDLDRVLERPCSGQAPVQLKDRNGWRVSIAAVLAAFEKARGDSRLLFTSRYDFAAVDGDGRDRAADLTRVHLQPFERKKRRRSVAAKRRAGR